MPDEHGKLSEEEYEVARTWLSENTSTACFCGSKTASLAPYVVSVRAETLNLFGEHTYFPALLTTCDKCGNFKFFSARRAGIKKHQVEPEEEDSDAG